MTSNDQTNLKRMEVETQKPDCGGPLPELPDMTNGMKQSGVDVDEVGQGLSVMEVHADKIISILGKSKTLEDCKTDLLNECEVLKSMIRKMRSSHSNTSGSELPSSPSKDENENGNGDENENEAEFDDGVSNFEYVEDLNMFTELKDGFPHFHANEMFAVRSEAINKVLLAEHNGETIPGPTKVNAIQMSILPYIDPLAEECQVVIIEPTRERAIQTHQTILKWEPVGDAQKKLRCFLCIGGTKFQFSKRNGVRKLPHIVVGTAGRLLDHLDRKHIDADKVRICILNHADKILNGIDLKINSVLEILPDEKVRMVAMTELPYNPLISHRRFFRFDPILIYIKNNFSFVGVKQFYADGTPTGKFSIVWRLFNEAKRPRCIIYCNSKFAANRIKEDFQRKHFNDVAQLCIKSNMSERDVMISEFLSGKRPVMITTDTRAPGLDLRDVSLVIVYDLPSKPEEYLIRVGLNGPVTGDHRNRIAITLFAKDELKTIKTFERYYRIKIDPLPENSADIFLNNEKEGSDGKVEKDQNGKADKNKAAKVDGSSTEDVINENKTEKIDGSSSEDTVNQNKTEKVDGSSSEEVINGNKTEKVDCSSIEDTVNQNKTEKVDGSSSEDTVNENKTEKIDDSSTKEVDSKSEDHAE